MIGVVGSRQSTLLLLAASMVAISLLALRNCDSAGVAAANRDPEPEPVPHESSDMELDGSIAERLPLEDASGEERDAGGILSTLKTDGPLSEESTRVQIYRLDSIAGDSERVAASLISKMEEETDPSQALQLYSEYLKAKYAAEIHRAAGSLVQEGRYVTGSGEFNVGLLGEDYGFLSIGTGHLKDTGASVVVEIPIPMEEFSVLRNIVESAKAVQRTKGEEYVWEFNSKSFSERENRYNEIVDVKNELDGAVRDGRYGDQILLLEQVPPSGVSIDPRMYLARLRRDRD